MKPETIARVAHEINRAYCAALGDNSQPAWEQAPEWQRKSALAGVEMHLANPDATPEQSHEAWLAQKLADGWTYGDVKDPATKRHPCCVPYDQLPPEQKAKDYLFRAVVHALKGIVEADELVKMQSPPAVNRTEPNAGFVSVTYVGPRAEWKDNLYASGLYFIRGQTRSIPYELSRKLLRHRDLFVIAEAKPAESAATAIAPQDDTQRLLEQGAQAQQVKHQEQSDIQALYDEIERMDKAALAQFAKTHYKQDIDRRKSVDTLRQEVRAFVDRFGVV